MPATKRGEIRIWHWLGAIAVAAWLQLAVLDAVLSLEPAKVMPEQPGMVLQLAAIPAPAPSAARSGAPPANEGKAKPKPSPAAKPPAPHEPVPKLKATPEQARKPEAVTTPMASRLKPARPAPARVNPGSVSAPKAVVTRGEQAAVARHKTDRAGAAEIAAATRANDSSGATKTGVSPTSGQRPAAAPGSGANTGARAASMPGKPGPQSPPSKAVYQGQLLAWIAQHKQYPRLARRQGLEGVVEVTFRLDANGRVEKSSLSTSSGYAILDQAVMQLLERASPMPAPPHSIDPGALTFRVPVAFTLH